jgi:hypothetical protein
MRFAKIVFTLAGIWGIVVLAPLFFLYDISGRQYTAPADYPQFFYGFLFVTLAWQIVFLIIGSDPVRYRLLMLPSLLEKFGFVGAMAVLYIQGRVTPADASAALPDIVLGTLFIASFVKTPRSTQIDRR